MLRPTKHSHPDRTVVNVAMLLLKHLRKRRLERYSDLRALVRRAVAGGDVLLLPALSFLFILGLVEYRSKNDAIEYVGPNEAL